MRCFCVLAFLQAHSILAATIDPNLILSPPTWTNGQVQFYLSAEAGSICVIEASPDLQNWTPVATNYDAGASRNITLPALDSIDFYRAKIPLAPILAYAVAADGNINFNGNGIVTDSFNSADPGYSTDSRYDPTKASTNGNVASIEGTINMGSHVMYGSVYLGRSASVVYTTGAQIQGSIYAIQNLRFPDVVLPPDPPIALSPTNGTNLVATSGFYVISNSLPIEVSAGVTAHLEITTNLLSGIQIHGGTTNSGTAYLYLAGTSATIFGNSALDASGQAKNLWVFGLPSLTSISFSGGNSSQFTGVIYAPSASATINAGPVTSMVGSLMVHSLTLNGHFTFHFDEDLLHTPNFP
jgi:hypothetical protein